MMSKLKKGQEFRGAVTYVLNEKKGAEIIAADGLMLDSIDSITHSFEAQAEMNPRLAKNVGHTVLSFSPNDAPRMSNDYMRQIALEYLERMGIHDTQFLIVRHHDREHPHCHIVFNRVSNSGKTVSDSNERFRSQRVCRDITEREGLYIAPGKEEVKRNRLREPDRTRYRIFDIIKAELPRHTDFNSFIAAVESHGVECTLINNGSTNKVQGIRFKMGKYAFNGSKIDKSCSYSKLIRALEANKPKIKPQPERQKPMPQQSHAPQQEYRDESQDFSLGLNLFQLHSSGDNVPVTETTWFKSRRRKPKKGRSV